MSRNETKSGSPAPVPRTQDSTSVLVLPVRNQKAKLELRSGKKKERNQTLIFGSDFSDLPDELLKELRLGPRTSLDAQILDVFRANRGTATLDEVLIGLYRKFAVMQKRRFLQNVLWRMVRKGHLTVRRGERGTFSLSPALSKPKRNRR